MKRLKILIAIILLVFIFNGCYNQKLEKESFEQLVTNSEGGGNVFELTFTKGKKHHYPMMAVWLEDENGRYVQTLYVARSFGKGIYQHADASKGKWEQGRLIRPATLPYFAHKRNEVLKNAEVFPTPENPVPDAYTGATPKTNFVLIAKSDKPLKGKYRVLFEINQLFDFNEYWHNLKYPDDENYKTSGQPAIVYATDIFSSEDLPINLTLKPIGHSHYSGKTGELFTDLSTLTTARQIVKNIEVKIR